MTPLELQDELVEEMKRILNGYEYKTPGGERVPINVYAQDIPIRETDDDPDPVPYIIVRLNKGDDEGGRDSANTVRVIIIVGMWDDGVSAQGHRDVMNAIQKVYERFSKNPNLNNKAQYSGDFHWAMQEDGYYPYYFGACTLQFYIAAIRREDPFA